jgi:leucine dehydrogenase
VAGYSAAKGGAGDPSRWTALGVLRGMEACIREKFNAHSFDNVTVAIQGVGHVGARLAHMLDNRGARLFLADHDHEQAVRIADRLGAQVVADSEIHKVKCDVFAPCGIGPVIDQTNVEELRCGIVAGSCSYQLASQEVGKRLFERDILYAPDYAINAGGLFHVVVTLRGQAPTRANILTNGIYETIERIIDLARQTHTPHSIVADIMARDKIMQTKARRIQLT